MSSRLPQSRRYGRYSLNVRNATKCSYVRSSIKLLYGNRYEDNIHQRSFKLRRCKSTLPCSHIVRALPADQDNAIEKYYSIALMHDIGKVSIPDEVLNKPGKLTDEEYELIKSHTERGYEVLKNISLMPEVAIGARAHHERPDGKGYPLGLKGDEIPRVAQIIAVADTFGTPCIPIRPYPQRNLKKRWYI